LKFKTQPNNMSYANTSTTRSMLSPDYHLYKSHVSA